MSSSATHTILKGFRLIAERSPAAGCLRLFELNAFKGLEADAVILLAGGFRPMREQEVYVAASRARIALVLADFGNNVPAGFAGIAKK